MKANIKVTFDMSFDDSDGKCTSSIGFEFPDHPSVQVSDEIRKLVLDEIHTICGAMENVDLKSLPMSKTCDLTKTKNHP